MAAIALPSGMATIEIDDYVLDVLMRDLVGHDRSPSAFLVYLYLWRRTRDGEPRLPLQRIAEGTGLSKRSVQAAIGHLEDRRLLRVKRESITAVPEYAALRPWAR
jgi:DNA-binding MarR family transcriptional regulator